jgi:hypothetical protein
MLLSPAVLPVVTVPAVVVTDPATSGVLGSGVSVKAAPVRGSSPVFRTMTV